MECPSEQGDATWALWLRGSRRERRQIRREVQDVVVGQRGDRLLHERRVAAVPRPVLEEIELARDVHRLQTGESRHVPQALQVVAVTNRAGDGLARSAALRERLA